ncbi:methyltransferase domain-containing protein, partial [Candidatus Micrarchaeota archaeon]|nr:methyltransferase domain-containing protein [Candidatus Micrarchaeota archaeon]
MGFFNNGKYYSLKNGTIEISGVRMHQIKDKTPLQDAEDKINELRIRRGKVLDVCTGLGYSAIKASEQKSLVTTIELDENVLKLAKENVDSKKLFNNPLIKIIIGDAFTEVKELPSSEFDIVMHDPPTISFAGELYSLEFYKELFRVLKHKGKLFHYTGSPGKNRGKNIPKGVAN